MKYLITLLVFIIIFSVTIVIADSTVNIDEELEEYNINNPDGVKFERAGKYGYEPIGKKGVYFDPRDIPGATINKDGSITLKDSIKIYSDDNDYAAVTKGSDGILSVEGYGAVELTDEEEVKIRITSNNVHLKMGDEDYAGKLVYERTKEKSEIKGEYIVEYDKNGERKRTVNGELRIYSNHETAKGSYTKYDGDKSFRFNFRSHTTIEGEWDGKSSYVTESDGNIKIIPKKGDFISASSDDTKQIYVGKIEGVSKVKFKTSRGEITFGRGEDQYGTEELKRVRSLFQDNLVTLKGDPLSLPEIKNVYKKPDGTEIEQTFSHKGLEVKVMRVDIGESESLGGWKTYVEDPKIVEERMQRKLSEEHKHSMVKEFFLGVSEFLYMIDPGTAPYYP